MRRKIGTAFKLDEQKILPKGEVKLQLPILLSSTLSHSPIFPLPTQAKKKTEGHLVVAVFVIPQVPLSGTMQ